MTKQQGGCQGTRHKKEITNNDKHIDRIFSFLISDLVDGELELELTRPLDWI